jgi:hypothetical protein
MKIQNAKVQKGKKVIKQSFKDYKQRRNYEEKNYENFG